MADNGALLRVVDLKKHFSSSSGLFSRKSYVVKAVDGITFEIQRGETLGLVGESGCGKSTTGRTILQLHRATAGEVYFKGKELTKMSSGDLRQLRTGMQMIFQDPYASLNPRHPISKIIGEPLVIHNMMKGDELQKRVAELLTLVGMDPGYMRRFPHEFSGGQRQRIMIARALSLNPEFIVCDEPISALDVSIQAQVVNLLQGLQEQLGLTYLFIAHDLSMVKHISHRIAVMYLGKIVELSTSSELFRDPLHPYTQSLISAVPIPNPRLEEKRVKIILLGEPPSPANPPPGCTFHPRCALANGLCKTKIPEFREIHPGHYIACHLADEMGTSKIAKSILVTNGD